MPTTLHEDDHDGGDTIVVKRESGSRTSSQDSLSPEIEPLVANLLSKIKPRLDLPEAYEDTPSGAEQPKLQQNRTPIKRLKTNATTMEDRLQQMPEQRPLPWRPGVEEGADVETGGDSRRKQIRFGCLLATRGQVQIPGCNSCVNGRGKFSLCIALDGYFKGACASCQLSGRPNRCSIKKEDDVASSPVVGTPSVEVSFNNGQQATPSSDSRPSVPPRKRKGTSEARRENEAKRASPKDVPQWSTQPPPQPTQYQTLKWGQQPLPLPPQPQQVNEIPQKAWATVNQPPPKSQLPGNGTNGNGQLAQEPYKPNTTTGWATVNQPQPQLQAQPQTRTHPQLQAAPPVQRQTQNGGGNHENGFHKIVDRERRESTVGEEGSGAFIDNLPKNKQRQVYFLISGLQSGIEHLQRELNSLRSALGIDDEN